MSIQQSRIIESQQIQLRKINKELSHARNLMKQVFESLPNYSNTSIGTKLAREELQDYLKDRGLL